MPVGRIAFANQLRGLAALSVVCSHLIGVYWLMRDFVSAATFSPLQPGPNPGIVALVNCTWFNLGPFGVGVFFLISGLVVPISLEKHSRASFLLARFLRVYPTYIVALMLEMAVLYAASRYWGRPFGHDPASIVSNALLVYNLVGMPSIDLVNWTLCVELAFYLLLVLFAPQVRRGSLPLLFGLALVLAAVETMLEATGAGRTPLGQTIGTEAVFLVYMLLGVLFNFHLRGLLRWPGFVAALFAMSTIFVLCWRSSAIAAQYPVVTVNYGYALILFGALYVMRRQVPDLLVLRLLAAISFPLYLIHSLIGFSILKALMLAAALPYWAALVLTLACLVAIAGALHVTVEGKTAEMGRRLAGRNFRRMLTSSIRASAITRSELDAKSESRTSY